MDFDLIVLIVIYKTANFLFLKQMIYVFLSSIVIYILSESNWYVKNFFFFNIFLYILNSEISCKIDPL